MSRLWSPSATTKQPHKDEHHYRKHRQGERKRENEWDFRDEIGCHIIRDFECCALIIHDASTRSAIASSSQRPSFASRAHGTSSCASRRSKRIAATCAGTISAQIAVSKNR